MALYFGKTPTLLGILSLAALLALSWDVLSPTACATEHPESSQQDDDPFSGGDDGQDPFGGATGEDPFARGHGASDSASHAQTDGQQQAQDRKRQAEHSTSAPDRQQVLWGESYSRGSQRIQQALDSELTPVGLDFEDTALEEIVAFLQDEYHIQIQIDTMALDDIGIANDELITTDLRDITLRSALRIMLRQLELTAIIADEVLLITTREECESRLSVAVYPVGDLTEDGKQSQHLINALLSTVATETWAENGGGESQIRALPGGLLVVSQTLAVHEQIADVLTAVRKARNLNE